MFGLFKVLYFSTLLVKPFHNKQETEELLLIL